MCMNKKGLHTLPVAAYSTCLPFIFGKLHQTFTPGTRTLGERLLEHPSLIEPVIEEAMKGQAPRKSSPSSVLRAMFYTIAGS